jgi:hypothetical protein
MSQPTPISVPVERIRVSLALDLAWNFLDDWHDRLTKNDAEGDAEVQLPDFLRALGYLEHQIKELIHT